MLVSLSIVVGCPVTIMASLNERIGNQPLQFGFTSLLFSPLGSHRNGRRISGTAD